MGKYIRPLALLSALLVLVQSCATIINGTTQKVTFVSDPPNADVYINGQKTWEKNSGYHASSKESAGDLL